MNTRWYFVQEGTTQGPVPFATLREMWLNGVIGPTQLIIREGHPHWQQASQVFADGMLPSSNEVASTEDGDLAALAAVVHGSKIQPKAKGPAANRSAGRGGKGSSPSKAWVWGILPSIIGMTLIYVWYEPSGVSTEEKARIMREQGLQGSDEDLAEQADEIKAAKENARKLEEHRDDYRFGN